MRTETKLFFMLFLLGTMWWNTTMFRLNTVYALQPQRRISKKRKLKRVGLKNGTHAQIGTDWYQLLSCDTYDNFIVHLYVKRWRFFHDLLPQIENMRQTCEYYSPYSKHGKKRGRKAGLRSVDLLGLVLWYVRTANVIYSLCPIFGLVPSSVSAWLKYGLMLVLTALKAGTIPEAQIEWPSIMEMQDSARRLEQSKPEAAIYLKGVFGVVDGGRFHCASYDDSNLHNSYFEGYTQNTEVTNLFLWNFYGEIIHAAINYPGSWLDSKIAGFSCLYWPRLSDKVTPPGYAIIGDSAFAANITVKNGKLLHSRKSNEAKQVPRSIEMAAVDFVLEKIYPAYRQTAEWGVNALKIPFRRLRTILPADSGRRFDIIAICCHLINYRTRTIGHNEIRSVFEV